MRVTFIANAGCIYESAGYRLLADPWLTPGAFEGSWFHFPPLRTRVGDLLGVDALYISHAHPDHYDPETLRILAAHRPERDVLVLDGPVLPKLLRGLGFTNVRACKPDVSVTVGPFTATLYDSFAPHLFHRAEIANTLDSAMVLQADGQVVLNANDNTPTRGAALWLHWRFGPPDLAQLNYNAAGPYPSCFANLTDAQKLEAHERILTRNLEHLAEIARTLQARAVQPFAGQYILGGRHLEKNTVLGTTSSAHAAQWLEDRGIPAIDLGERMTVDVKDMSVTGTDPLRQLDRMEYARALEYLRYPYEQDPPADYAALVKAIEAARAKLWAVQTHLNAFPPWTIVLAIPEGSVAFRLDNETIYRRQEGAWYPAGPSLHCFMDTRLLLRILDGRAHWNHAEIGCHIEFYRRPDVYVPDIHTLLEHFHA